MYRLVFGGHPLVRQGEKCMQTKPQNTLTGYTHEISDPWTDTSPSTEAPHAQRYVPRAGLRSRSFDGYRVDRSISSEPRTRCPDCIQRYHEILPV